jgi:hypothetical protein
LTAEFEGLVGPLRRAHATCSELLSSVRPTLINISRAHAVAVSVQFNMPFQVAGKVRDLDLSSRSNISGIT